MGRLGRDESKRKFKKEIVISGYRIEEKGGYKGGRQNERIEAETADN